MGAAAGAGRLGRRGEKIPIGLQVYSVRNEAQKDLAGVLAQVAEMGYEGVEFAGYYNWPAEKIRKVLDQHNLKCCGTHTGVPAMMGDEFAKTVEFNKIIGNKNLIAPQRHADGLQEACGPVRQADDETGRQGQGAGDAGRAITTTPASSTPRPASFPGRSSRATAART